MPRPCQRLFFLDMGLSCEGGACGHMGRIVSCSTDGTDQVTVLSGLGIAPDGIAVDPEHEHIYWTNMGRPLKDEGTICRVNIDGSNPMTFIPEGVTFTPKQCTIDALHRKLYWCDREGMRVMRVNLDSSDVETIIIAGDGDEDRKDSTRHCVGIAVDPARGKIYWTQKGFSKGNRGRIFRANMELIPGETARNRSDIECLVDGLPEPIDLDLDPVHQVLYCTDRGDPPRGNCVYRLDVGDGVKVHKPEILVRKLHEGIGLTLDVKHGKAYIGDLAGSIYSADLVDPKIKVLIPDAGDLTGLALVDFV